MKLSQLSEKATIGNILPDTAPELDPLAPVVAPVVQAARLEAVCPDQNVVGSKINDPDYDDDNDE